MRARSWRLDGRCDRCREETVVIEVKRSRFGYAMYGADLVAAALLVLFVAHRDFQAGFATFMAEVNSDLYLAGLFGLIIASFVFAFLDMGRTNQEARRLVDERKGRIGS